MESHTMDTSTFLAESWTKMYKEPADDLGWMDGLNVSSFRDEILPDIHKYKTRQSEMGELEKEPAWNHNEVYKTQYPQYTRPYRSTDVKPHFKAPAPVMRHESALKKPPMSYANMAALALKNSPTGELPVKDIYKFMIEHWPYYKNAPGSWKNSVRHNLSTNEKFMKREINQHKMQGKNPSVWLIVPEMMGKVDLDLALASTRTDNEEDYENNENMTAAAAIVSSPVARAEGRPYKYTPRNVAQRPSFTFKPAKETMASFAHCAIFIRTRRPSSFADAACPPSEIGLFDSPAPQNSQRAPMRRPALVPAYPTGESASYELMKSPSRFSSTNNAANGRSIRDPSDISLSAALDAKRIRMSTPSILTRKRPAAHPGNTEPSAKASYGMMRNAPRSMDNEVNTFRGERMHSPLKDSWTLNSLNGGAIRDPYDISPFGSPVRRIQHNPITTNSLTTFIANYSSISSLEAPVSGDLFENLDDFFILRDE